MLLLAGFAVPEIVVVNLVAGLATRAAVTLRLRARINWSRVALLSLGSIPGAWLGAETVSILPEHALKRAAGVVVVLCGIGLAIIPTHGDPHVPSKPAYVLTGAVGGFLSTTTSLNGPPPVLLFARARLAPLSFIADLAGYFIVINTLSLFFLWLRNAVPHTVLWPELPQLVVAALVGNALGLWIAHRLPAHLFRGAVIALVIVSGAAAVVV